LGSYFGIGCCFGVNKFGWLFRPLCDSLLLFDLDLDFDQRRLNLGFA
jgi:hypothetical protein